MPQTDFSQTNYDFSSFASSIAERTIYRDLVHRHVHGTPSPKISLRDVGQTRADFEQGIDRILMVEQGEKRWEWSVQERFRRQDFAKYREITVVGHHAETGAKPEIDKIEADLYVYGYIDLDLEWIEAIVVRTQDLLRLYKEEIIVPETGFNPRTKQTFLNFPFDRLLEENIVLWHTRK